MTILIILFSLLLLVVLISAAKANPFISFLIVAIVAGTLLGIPFDKIAASVQKGIGDILGSLLCVILFGAMLGKLVAESGAAQKIASVMTVLFGVKNIQWGLMLTGFIVGIPLFYSVGFVVLVPLVFSIAYKYKLPAVYVGLPMLAALSVTHGFLPPHPSPSALVAQFKANMGITMLYGILLASVAIVVAGPLYAQTLKGLKSRSLRTFISKDLPAEDLPGAASSFFSALLPTIVLSITAVCSFFLLENSPLKAFFSFVGEPTIAMLLTLLITTYTLGIRMGKKIKEVMNIYAEAAKDIAMIIFIIAGSGALKQVLDDSNANQDIAHILQNLRIDPLVLGWMMAALIRVCIGSATVAGLTAANIIHPLMIQEHSDPNLMVLSIGAGSLMFSHVNDPSFWMFKEYFNLSIKQTILSWSMMETLVSLVGLIGALVLQALL